MTLTVDEVCAACDASLPEGTPPRIAAVRRHIAELRREDLFVDLVREGETPEDPDAVVARDPVAVLTTRPGDYHRRGYLRTLAPPDPVRALCNIGRVVRDRRSVTSVAVTGSVGKSSTVQLLAHVLRADGRRVATTQPHDNDELGVPLVCANLDSAVDTLVLELASWRLGEVADCAHSCRPHVGVITAIDKVHLARFGSAEAIVAEKCSLLAAVEEWVVVPDCHPALRELARRHPARVRTVSHDRPAAVTASSVVYDRDRTRVVARYRDGGSVRLDLPPVGPGGVTNALCAAFVCRSLGVSPEVIASATQSFAPALRGRLRFSNAGGCLIVDDAHNASVMSCNELAHVLRRFDRRVVAVFGGISEGGPERAALNTTACAALDRVSDVLICYGDAAPFAPPGASCVDEDAVFEAVMGTIRPRDVIAFKGSRVWRGKELAAAVARTLEAR